MLKSINQKFLLLGIITIAGIIASPFVYAAVEPHIILVMDAGQTTNPFTIQNNTGTDIFTVGTIGDINNINHLTIKTNEADVYTVTAAHDLANPLIVQGWQFSDKSFYPGGEYRIISLDPVVTVIIQRDSGVSSCHFGWYTYDGSWNARTSDSGSDASYTVRFTSTGEGWLEPDAEIVAFIVYNGDSATTCSFKSIIATMDIVLPGDMTMYKMVP